PKKGVFREPDLDAAKAAISAALYPFQIEGGHMPDIRKKLYEVMWEDAGILRDAESLARARVAVDELHSELMRTGVADESRAYNLSWHDWLNLESQIIISKAVIEAAVVRKDSRGAHFREDFPEIHDLENSRFTKASLDNGKITITSELVEFTRVRPGETLIND
ncbi:MAG: succinate dehydrogenase/fumarate reductase flavoprotein subunit, partial [Rhodospirillales bacterium]